MKEKKLTDPKQLSVWLAGDIHREIKMRAAAKNVSMALYIERILLEALQKERKDD